MRIRLLLLLLLIAVPVAALGVSGAAARASRGVSLRDNHFSPKRITIRRGTRVVWHWRGRHRHNVFGRGFHSSTKRHGSFSHIFRHRGTFRVLCTIHPGMKMRIRVR